MMDKRALTTTEAQRANPVIDEVRNIIKSQVGVALKPYQFITQLSAKRLIAQNYGASALGLYKVNFLLYNALYTLQKEYLEQHLWLRISNIEVSLWPAPQAEEAEQWLSDCAAQQLLADFYLDWRHYDCATEQESQQLLESFWRRLSDPVAVNAALEVLELSPSLLQETGGDLRVRIKTQYRRLAMQHHPDRGGDAASLQQINHAYSVLKNHIG